MKKMAKMACTVAIFFVMTLGATQVVAKPPIPYCWEDCGYPGCVSSSYPCWCIDQVITCEEYYAMNCTGCK